MNSKEKIPQPEAAWQIFSRPGEITDNLTDRVIFYSGYYAALDKAAEIIHGAESRVNNSANLAALHMFLDQARQDILNHITDETEGGNKC